jgi:hypothetical protein
MNKIEESYKSSGRRWVQGILGWTAVALCLVAGQGAAQAHEGDNPDKGGRVMLNARGGAAIGLANAGGDLNTLGMVGLDFGVALSSDYNAYLVLTPQVDLRQGLYNVMVPLGFQYDIRLARGLYLYPRVSLGYSAIISNASADFGSLHFSANQVTHGGVGIPELGLKYVINGHFNLGIEPLSFPIFFTDRDYVVWYRAMVFLGATF